MFNKCLFKKSIKLENNSNSLVVNINDNFNYKNIINILNNSIIDEKYLVKIFNSLKYVYFIDNTMYKNTSIDYISWINQDGKEVLKLENKFKAPNNHYYEFIL